MFGGSEDLREEVSALKDREDKHHLSYENLVYEKVQTKRVIQHCKDFRLDLRLVSFYWGLLAHG